MAAASGSALQIRNITDCSICLETFKEPKLLPCIHTFCLQCLHTYCESKKPDEELACPLCRKVFSLPSGEAQNLPNNFFVIQLQQVNKLTDATEKTNPDKLRICEWCSDSESTVTATSYCIECDQHICDRCAVVHKKQKVTRSHQVVHDNEMRSLEERIKLVAGYCDQHLEEKERFFCTDCKLVTCHKCFEEKHCDHKWIDVTKAAEKFREQLKDDVDKVAACALKNYKKTEQLKSDMQAFMEKVTSTQNEISNKYDQLVSLIQSHKSELMEELNLFKDKIVKRMETEKDEFERQFVITESFNRYCLEMINKGSACHVTRTALDLHARAEELVKTQDEADCREINIAEMSFKPFIETTAGAVKNFIGELTLTGDIFIYLKFVNSTKVAKWYMLICAISYI